MWYAVYGFVFGMLIPYMARRFSKFMPATMAYAVYRLDAGLSVRGPNPEL